jgi:hypothetical protein
VIETPTEILAHYTTEEAAASFIAWRKKAKRLMASSQLTNASRPGW